MSANCTIQDRVRLHDIGISFSSRNRDQAIAFEIKPATFAVNAECAYRTQKVSYKRRGHVSLRRRNQFSF